MTQRYQVVRAALVAALLVCAAGVPAVAQDGASATGTLPGGVTYEIRPDASQTAAAVALWYRAPSAGFDGHTTPGLSRLAAATVAASTPITGTPLGRLVSRYGGNISVAAYPNSVTITVVVPPDRIAPVVRAMTEDYFAPVVDAKGLAAAQRDVAEDSLVRSYEPVRAIEDALGAALFASGPFHEGTIGSAQAIGGVTLDRVRAFAERAFRPGNAILVLTGKVDPSVLKTVATRNGADPAAEQAPSPAPAPASTVVRRDSPISGTGLGWTGPAISDETGATAMDFIADALFAPKIGIAQRALGSRKAAVTGKFVTYRNPGVFLVTISGDEADAARPIVEKAIAGAASPMSPAAFASARSAFVYRLLSEMQTPAELADTYGWYAVEGNAPYAPAEAGASGRYFSVVSSLTPDVVARTASRYLAASPAVVTLVKRSSVSEKRP